MRSSPVASKSSDLLKSLSNSSSRISGGRGALSGRVRKSTSSHAEWPSSAPFISGVVCTVISSSSCSRSVTLMYGSVPEPASASVGTPEAEIRLSLSSAAVDGGSTGAGSSAGGGGVRWATPVQSICSSRPSTPPTRTLKPPSHAPASTRVPPARLSASEAAGAAGGSSESGSKTGGGRVRAPCTPSWYERVSLLPSAVGLKRITVWSVGKSEVVVVSASTLAMSNDGANRYRHPSSGGTGGAGTRHAGSPRMSHSCQAPKGRYVLLYIANRRESTAWRDSGTGRWKASSSTSSRAW
mmetsp:Transcript_32850/g.106204  ORF Transcript_32850/g.106204 Transcript_32850/m.106204 type:complete len:297 (-) Transcript_32850:1631-2521(-)